MVQLYADGYDQLPLREKTLIWHLYQAAVAGRDIYYDQRYAHNLEMRDVLEEIITHPEDVDPQTLAEIQRYTKLFWINTGPYNNLTARKFVLKYNTRGICGCGARGAEERRAAVPHSRRRIARRHAQAHATPFLRSEGRPDRHQQDARCGQGHPVVERQQSVCRRDDEGARRLSTNSTR